MKKKIMLIIIMFIISIIVFLIYKLTTATEEVQYQSSLALNQPKTEEKITSYGYTIDNPNIILNPYGISPLTALVIFETEEEVIPNITIKGHDPLTTYHYQTPKSKVHYIPIYGLYANYNNEINISYNKIEKKISILTEKLPKNIIKPTSIEKNEEELTNSLYFYTPSDIGYACAYDINGDIRWYLTEKLKWAIKRLKNGHILLSTENKLYNSYSTGLYEMDLNGKIYTEYQIDGGYYKDYYELPNDNILIITNNKGADSIVEINRKTGQTVKTIDINKIIDIKKKKLNNNFLSNISAISYDEQTNSLIVTEESQNLIFNIDYNTNKINYIIGRPNNVINEKYFLRFSNDDQSYYKRQAVTALPNQELFIFENLQKDSTIQSNRSTIYHIDSDKKTITSVYSYTKEDQSNYLVYHSDIDYINEGRYLIHLGGKIITNKPNSDEPLKTVTTEIKNGEVIWKMELPTNNYQSEKISLDKINYQKETVIKLNNAKETKTDGKNRMIFKYYKNDDYYNKRKIQIYQDTLRVTITGEFLPKDKASIILEKNFQKKVYVIKNSNNVCQDCNKQKITKTINKVNIQGKYSIYIKINNKIYKTNQYVKF